eukprot:14409830-Alexandrium_andersonii.AAC.1
MASTASKLSSSTGVHTTVPPQHASTATCLRPRRAFASRAAESRGDQRRAPPSSPASEGRWCPLGRPE